MLASAGFHNARTVLALQNVACGILTLFFLLVQNP